MNEAIVIDEKYG